MERQQRNHRSHFIHGICASKNNSNNKRKHSIKHRKQHHKNNKLQPDSAQEPHYNNQNSISPDQNHSNYEHIIGDKSQDEENSCSSDMVIFSEDTEITNEHDDDEVGNSYSCNDTLTDDVLLSASNQRANKLDFSKEANYEQKREHTNQDSGSGGDTCCSCSDTSCVYEEPPSHAIQTNHIQKLKITKEN